MIQPPNQSNNEPGVPRPGPGPTPPNQLNQQGQQPRPSFWRRNLLWIILLLVIPWGIFLFWQANSSNSGAEPVSYSMMITQAAETQCQERHPHRHLGDGHVQQPVHSDQVSQTDAKFTTTIPAPTRIRSNKLLQYGVKINTVDNNNANLLITLLLQWGPFLMLASSSTSSFVGRARLRTASSASARAAPACTWAARRKTTFADVAGVDEAKADLEEVVDFLKNPDRYLRLGGKLPKGVLAGGSSGNR